MIQNSGKLSTYFSIGGNASPADADLICFAVDPKNPGTILEYAAAINEIGCDCLIYVEMIPKGSEKEFLNFLNPEPWLPKITVRGWDILSMGDLAEQLENQIQLLQTFRKQINDEMELHPKDKVSIIKGSYRLRQGPFWLFLKLAWSEIHEDWKEIYYHQITPVDWDTFQFKIQQLFAKAIFRFRQKQRNLFKTTFQLRLRHLKHAIKEGLETKKKVLVTANQAFFIPSPHLTGEEYDISKFLSFLSRRKVAILTSTKSSLSPPHFLPPSPLLSIPSLEAKDRDQRKVEEEQDALNSQELRPSSPHLDELDIRDISTSCGYPEELEVEIKIYPLHFPSQKIACPAPLKKVSATSLGLMNF